jgi:hypothetical protein
MELEKTYTNIDPCDDETVLPCLQTPESQNASITESECNNMELTGDMQIMSEIDENDQRRCGTHHNDSDSPSNPLYDDIAFGGDIKKGSI